MGSYLPHLRLSAAMVSRLTLLSLFAIVPSIYSGGYYRSKPAKSVLETLVADPRFSLQTLLVPFLQTLRGSRLSSLGTLSPRRFYMWAKAPSLSLRQEVETSL